MSQKIPVVYESPESSGQPLTPQEPDIVDRCAAKAQAKLDKIKDDPDKYAAKFHVEPDHDIHAAKRVTVPELTAAVDKKVKEFNAARRAAVREEYTMELAASKRPGPSIEKALLPGTTAIDFDNNLANRWPDYTPASKSDVIGSWIQAETERVGKFETKDSGERASFESGMVRDVTTGKTLWHKVFDGPLLRRWAELLTRGAEKYPDEEAGLPNWMLADGNTEWVRFRESAFRHFMQWYNGDSDEDHAAAVCFNLNGAEYVQDKLDKIEGSD